MSDLLPRDYAPRSTLELEEHFVEKPRFPAIDAHNHDMFWISRYGIPSVSNLVEVMDRCGITAIVNLDGKWGHHLEVHLDKYDRAYPGRFCTFANVDWSRWNEPDFGEKMAAQLEESVAAGARGLKIYKTLGLELRDETGALLWPDDARWDPIWATAGELGIPVMIHLADPPCFWEPLDRHNEGYLILKGHPQWNHHGPQFLGFRELMDSGLRLMGRHPDTVFIAAHTGWFAGLRFVGEQMLDKLPNVHVDFSACISILGRQPYSMRQFLIEYQDRVLFGTDSTPSTEVYHSYYRWLETKDEYFEVSWDLPWGDRRIYGVHLPDGVLEKIYCKNAQRLIPGLS